MARVPCELCPKTFLNKNSYRTHFTNYHKDTITKQPIDLHIQVAPIDNKLDLHLHQAIEDPLDKYLKDRNNRYDAKDFDNYLKVMKSKDKKSVKAEPYARPEEDGEGGPSSGNVGELSICHICDGNFLHRKHVANTWKEDIPCVNCAMIVLNLLIN